MEIEATQALDLDSESGDEDPVCSQRRKVQGHLCRNHFLPISFFLKIVFKQLLSQTQIES